MRPMQFAAAAWVAAFLAGTALQPAAAADRVTLRVAVSSVPTDIHTKALHVFADQLAKLDPNRFDVQIYDSGSLFKQGADLDALERGNAEMTYVSFQQIADEIPAYSLFTIGYLFKNPAHLHAVFDSETGSEMKAQVSKQMGIELLGICYLGTRELNLRSLRKVETPADLAGVKMRMPDSQAWMFLGKALGANPTPLPFNEVYLALQTGTIDAQDNPLPTDEAAKFYEVTKQVTLTNHVVDSVMLALNDQTWSKLGDADKAALKQAATAACAYNDEAREADEAKLIDFFKSKGLAVTTPDVAAFRKHVQEVYLASPMAKTWPAGWLDKINALAN